MFAASLTPEKVTPKIFRTPANIGKTVTFASDAEANNRAPETPPLVAVETKLLYSEEKENNFGAEDNNSRISASHGENTKEDENSLQKIEDQNEVKAGLSSKYFQACTNNEVLPLVGEDGTTPLALSSAENTPLKMEKLLSIDTPKYSHRCGKVIEGRIADNHNYSPVVILDDISKMKIEHTPVRSLRSGKVS